MKGSSAVLYPEMLRENLALVACVSFLGACCFFFPRSPFSPVFFICALASAAAHLGAWLAFPRFRDRPLFFIALAWFNVALVSILVGDTGRISSPFIFLFFWIIVSQAVYGVEDRWLPFFATACYLFSIYGDALSLVPHTHTLPDPVCDSLFTAAVSSLICIYIILGGLSTRYIIRSVLGKLDSAGLKQEELGKKCAEMSPYSQIGTTVHRIAHDLRTPLASALGYLDFKVRKATDPDDIDLLKMISESLEQMSSMLTQITCYGRRSDLKKERLCLKALLSGVKTMLSYHPAAAGVAITARFPEGELCVEMPRHELQLAFYNVIKNSLDAVGPVNEKKVEIVLRRDGVNAEVEVSDSGPGLPEGRARAALKAAGSSKADGAGVGLSITSDFIQEHGGTFEISNGALAGALVRIRLPLCTPPLANQPGA